MGIKNSNNNYVILSAERSQLDMRTNIQRTAELEDILQTNKIKYQRAGGRWGGVREVSLIVELIDYHKDLQFLKGIAMEFNQDAILEIKQGHGWLHYLRSGNEEFIGTMKQVRDNDNYTELSNGYRFAIIK